MRTRERDADGPRAPQRARATAGSPDGITRVRATTRERPANRPGRRPLARHRACVERPARPPRKGGWNRGRPTSRPVRARRSYSREARHDDEVARNGAGRGEPGVRGARARLGRGAARRRRRATRSTRCATRRRTSWRRRSWASSRTRAGHRAGHPATASTTTSSCRGPLTPDDLAAIEARMRGVDRGRPPVRAPRVRRPDEGRAFFEERGQPFKVEILDDLARAAADAAGQPPPVDSTYQHGPFVDLCRARTWRRTGADRAVQAADAWPAPTGAATRSGRCSSASTARSGQTQEELDRYLVAARGGQEARPPPARRRSSTCSASTTSAPGSAFWHPKGQRLWRTLEDAMRELQDRRGYEEISTPILVHQKLWEQSGHWRYYARQHVPARRRGPDASASSR